MKKRAIFAMSVLVSAFAFSTGGALAIGQASAQKKSQANNQEQIYGNQLMTEQELAEQRAKMRAAKTVQEREQIRTEQHERMTERAKERGVTLPDEPCAKGGDVGPAGRGMGPGNRGAGQGSMPSFSDFDQNKDGKITEDEFSEARTAKIIDRAQKGYQMRGLSNASSFADMDTNQDGAISPEEFSAHQSLNAQQMGK